MSRHLFSLLYGVVRQFCAVNLNSSRLDREDIVERGRISDVRKLVIRDAGLVELISLVCLADLIEVDVFDVYW